MKGIIFDIDGVLIDADDCRIEKYKKLFGDRFNRKFKDFLLSDEYSGIDSFFTKFSFPDSKKLMKQYADGIALDDYKTIDDIQKVLKELSQKYILVAYSAADIDISTKKLEICGIRQYFKELFCGNSGDSNAKEEAIKNSIDYLSGKDIAKNDIYIVDDRVQAGVVIGKKYGIKRVRFDRGIHSTNEYVPDYIIKALRELEAVLDPKVVVVSGYFNPLHKGHVRYFEAAKALGDKLIVIVNNDLQVKLKGSVPFMDEEERIEIIKSLKSVDKVVLSIDRDLSVCKTLELLGAEKPSIFANGGDRTVTNIPETKVCQQLGMKMVFGVGGNKLQSSSQLIKTVRF